MIISWVLGLHGRLEVVFIELEVGYLGSTDALNSSLSPMKSSFCPMNRGVQGLRGRQEVDVGHEPVFVFLEFGK